MKKGLRLQNQCFNKMRWRMNMSSILLLKSTFSFLSAAMIFLNFVYFAIFSSLLICLFITVRMCCKGTKDFINCFIIWLLLFELIIGSIMNYNHFKVGFINLIEKEDPESINYQCTVYVNLWIAFWTFTGCWRLFQSIWFMNFIFRLISCRNSVL